MKDLIGPSLQIGYGISGFYLAGAIDYALNSIYGTSNGGGFRLSGEGMSVQPLFLGLCVGFHLNQNKFFNRLINSK